MLDSLFMFGMALLMLGLIALCNPILVGWRNRKEALVALAIGGCLLTAGWAARFL
jgi:hypothetical protein